MKNEEIDKLLNLAILSKAIENTSDDFIDLVFSKTERCPDEQINRMRKLFVEKVILEKHPKPIMIIEKKITFGAWLEEKRKSLNLVVSDVANALRVKEPIIENLEKSRTNLWQLSPDFAADFMDLFRIHFTALHQLVSTSASVNKTNSTGTVFARSQNGKMVKSRGDSTARALELFLANNVKRSELSDDLLKWFESLKKTLNDRANTDLI